METEGIPHVCEEKVKTELYVRADLQTTPLSDPEMTIFCDGCSYRAKEGHIVSSYAVVEQLPLNEYRVMEAQQISKGSAQVAEITAMLRALQLSEGKAVNIYTDCMLGVPAIDHALNVQIICKDTCLTKANNFDTFIDKARIITGTSIQRNQEGDASQTDSQQRVTLTKI